MANLNNSIKQKLEHLFGMQTGYVLDFSDATFRDFIQTSIGIDVDEKYIGSKARRLRQLWQHESNEDVARLTLEMLDRWQTNMLVGGTPISSSDQTIYEMCIEGMQQLGNKRKVNKDELQFLAKDFGDIDLSKINIPVSFKDVMEQRIDEVERSIKSQSPLAVVFLCGSTLEGLLYEVASKNINVFNRCKSSPKYKGAVKQLSEWTLENLITTSRELQLIGEDVVKHAHAVKDFRNYIHPRQQIKENFKPRMFTAEMATKVLYATIADLSTKNND